MLTMSASRAASRRILRAAAADDQRRVGFLYGHGGNLQLVDLVELALEARPLAPQERLQHGDGFLQPSDAHPHRVEGDAGQVVLVLEPPGPDAQLDAAVGEDVDRADRHGQDDRVAEVVVEDEPADLQPLRHHRRRGHRRHRLEAAHEVVRPHQRVVAEGFHLAHRLDPRIPRRADAAALHSETERECRHRRHALLLCAAANPRCFHPEPKPIRLPCGETTTNSSLMRPACSVKTR